MPQHAKKWGQGRQKTSAMPKRAKTWGIAGSERAIMPSEKNKESERRYVCKL